MTVVTNSVKRNQTIIPHLVKIALTRQWSDTLHQMADIAAEVAGGNLAAMAQWAEGAVMGRGAQDALFGIDVPSGIVAPIQTDGRSNYPLLETSPQADAYIVAHETADLMRGMAEEKADECDDLAQQLYRGVPTKPDWMKAVVTVNGRVTGITIMADGDGAYCRAVDDIRRGAFEGDNTPANWLCAMLDSLSTTSSHESWRKSVLFDTGVGFGGMYKGLVKRGEGWAATLRTYTVEPSEPPCWAEGWIITEIGVYNAELKRVLAFTSHLDDDVQVKQVV